MANPSGNHQEAGQPSSSFDGGNPSNGNSTPVPAADNSSSALAMKHNPGISTDWTSDEQVTLEEGLKKYAAESSVIRYAKIAMQLPNKTVRDVALRCRWMNKKENSKRRKEEHNLTRKNKDKKERVSDSSMKSAQVAARPNVPPYGMPMIPMDNDDGVSYKAIGGTTGELLEQNAHAMNQISSNLASFQIQDNISLFCQTRDNILKIMNDLNEMPEVMKQMPPLPVKVNEELANTILPPTSHSLQS
ncbi:hypothetical protein IC582_017328 [Cucumis melo]|uniref:Uncharacterized protein LOC103494613 n=2 Tax=Cucumis TaxID=3655 RepID=A0A1S3BYL7_CUCME|nr:uncharacterized protein LOC101222201 isoform X2 [Cucumis sativus]XP_050943330.1 uncharacterized protein LOC103494613 [Cucumis melo]XP_050943331.1 uncharacterized protein LOC103494613 [Cucumis melo]XP_050943332.1 uncharacterized protein LOC103494613 [Cucumis melo]